MRRRQFRFTRDTILFVSVLAGVAYETFFENSDRPSLIILFAAMMGLPLYLRKNGH